MAIKNLLSLTQAERDQIAVTTGTNTGDQDLSGLAEKTNVLELDNTTPFTPNADYEPSTKKYVDDLVTAGITLKGEYDAATNTPDLETPAQGVVNQGDLYVVTVAGTFFTTDLMVGDALISNTEDPSVEADWIIMCRGLDAATVKILYESNADTNAFTDAAQTTVGNQSGTNTGDQDLSGLALKTNVLELDNTTSFTPDADYEPATKKYVDDNSGGGGVMVKSAFNEATTDKTTTTTSWGTTLLSIAITPASASSYFIINFTASGDANTSDDSRIQFRLSTGLTGSEVVRRATHIFSDNVDEAGSCALAYRIQASGAGENTIKVEWRLNSGGTARIRPVTNADGDHASLMVQEVTA